MKKLLSMLLLMLLSFSMFAGIGQAESIVPKLFLNGKQLETETRIVNNSTLVPIRAVAEGLGFDVSWNQSNKTVGIHNGTTQITLKIDDRTALVNDKTVNLDTPAKIFNDTSLKYVTMVPIRFVSETMGLKVNYDNLAKSVYLDKPIVAPGEGGGASTSVPDNVTGLLKSIRFDGLGTVTIDYDGQVNVNDPIILSDTDRIVIDMPNAYFASEFNPAFVNTSALTGEISVDNHPNLTKIRYSYYSDNPSTVRVVLDLKAKTDYQLIKKDGSIQISLLNGKEPVIPSPVPTPPPSSGGDKIFKVVIDAGHGGKDPGAESSGRSEKDYNLSLSLKVNKLLMNEPRIKPYMTRTDETFVSLDDRASFANNLNADLFISLHANKADSSSASGTESFYYHTNSQTLAQIIHKHVLKAAGLKDRGVKTAGYFVIKKTTMPAILIESGFLSNQNDSSVLFDETKQNEIAKEIVAGIKEYLNI